MPFQEDDIPKNLQGHPDRRMIMFVILIGIAMAVVDGIVVSIALPTITGFFGVPVAQSQWVITAYLVTETSLLLIFGKVAEYVGKSRVFIAGFFIFTASSLACGLSASLSGLILFRIVQATGAAMVFSISAAIIFEIFPKGEQGRAMGYIGATIAIASIAAPMLGGFITDTLGWEYIFLINVPIGIVLLVLAIRFLTLPETPSTTRSLDWVGGVTMIIGMASLIMLLGELAGEVRVSGAVIFYLALFIVSITLFLVQEHRHENPLLDMSVFRNKKFTLANISMILLFIGFFMVNIVGPFYFEGVLGLKPYQVGIVFLVAPIIMVIASPVSGWLYDRHPSRYTAAAGITLSGASLIYLGRAAYSMDLTLIVLGFIPMAIGNALFQSPNNTEIMRALPPEKIGTASSVSATVRNLGMTLGVSLSSILLTYQLQSAGYSGPVIGAPPAFLVVSISTIMIAGGGLCFIGAVASLVGSASVRKTSW
ncbi:MAG: DHA2 family efflux MFS transporter permease subunit [Methanoregulaceae archaeon]|nr:DHA2 family efflux MFS transporter permease subunit [Methanoregulaceae archaeon]